MSKQLRGGSVRWLVAGVMIFVVAAVPLLAQPPEKEALKKATADGKYTKLLTVIHVPSDKGEYGDFNDYGDFDGTEWAGYKGLPKGKWVYVHPHWYIWEKEGKGGDVLPLQKASVKGKYNRLLAIIHVPGDKGEYGEFNDHGDFDGDKWAGYSGLPKGKWVYVYPHWYIWEKESK